jgi:hypothetical protein
MFDASFGNASGGVRCYECGGIIDDADSVELGTMTHHRCAPRFPGGVLDDLELAVRYGVTGEQRVRALRGERARFVEECELCGARFLRTNSPAFMRVRLVEGFRQRFTIRSDGRWHHAHTCIEADWSRL